MAWGKSYRKYQAGPIITNEMTAIACILNRQYLMVRGKPMHPSVMRNWSLEIIILSVRHGHIRVAELTPEAKNREQDHAQREAEMDQEFLELVK